MFARKDVCLAIAQNKSLRVLDIKGIMASYIYPVLDLSKAIAINSKLGGSLVEVHLNGSI
jgi:hypothetical protein